MLFAKACSLCGGIPSAACLYHKGAWRIPPILLRTPPICVWNTAPVCCLTSFWWCMRDRDAATLPNECDQHVVVLACLGCSSQPVRGVRGGELMPFDDGSLTADKAIGRESLQEMLNCLCLYIAAYVACKAQSSAASLVINFVNFAEPLIAAGAAVFGLNLLVAHSHQSWLHMNSGMYSGGNGPKSVGRTSLLSLDHKLSAWLSWSLQCLWCACSLIQGYDDASNSLLGLQCHHSQTMDTTLLEPSKAVAQEKFMDVHKHSPLNLWSSMSFSERRHVPLLLPHGPWFPICLLRHCQGSLWACFSAEHQSNILKTTPIA